MWTKQSLRDLGQFKPCIRAEGTRLSEAGWLNRTLRSASRRCTRSLRLPSAMQHMRSPLHRVIYYALR